MSIWSSIDGAFDVQAWDLTPDWNGAGVSGLPTVFVDVATATPWHNNIRLIVGHDEVLLTATSAWELANRLSNAANRVAAS